ncbi:MAG: biotin/lipoyl-containing protein [Gaiellaceae bacterium]
MPGLVDITIRLLGQEPLAGRVPAADLYRLAELLDGAGFSYLEISGGGCFEAAVRRGIESPWERIRAIRMRTSTPLAMALRGRFLVGSHPVDPETVRRFVASASDNGIDVFRLDDPLNDVENLRDAAEAVISAGKQFEGGLHYGSEAGRTELLLEAAGKLPELGAVRIVLHDPAGSLPPSRAHGLVRSLRDVSGLPVGVHCRGVGGNALAASIEAARGGAELIACSLYPVALTLHRAPAEALAQALEGLGLETPVDIDTLWQGSDLLDEHIGDQVIAPLAPRIAVRAAEYGFPADLVANLDAHLRSAAAGDRLDDVLDELVRVRKDLGSPPLASPISQLLGSQALLHVLSASRYQTIVDQLPPLVLGEYGRTPGEVDPAVRRAIELRAADMPTPAPPPSLEDVRQEAEGLAASEEELLLLGLFREGAEGLLRSIRGRGTPEGIGMSAVERSRAERIREIVRIVQEHGVSEITIEDEEMRVTVRSGDEHPDEGALGAPLALTEPPPLPERRPPAGTMLVEAPMVGTFYRSPNPGSEAFVDVGDAVEPGQTLCILEAMKLMNPVKSEVAGRVARICKQDGDAVQFGEVLFELEPLAEKPLDAY